MNAPPVTATVPAKRNGETASLTKAARDDLLRLARMRERVAKSGLGQGSARLLAEFEQQMASEYSYDQDTRGPRGHESTGADRGAVQRAGHSR